MLCMFSRETVAAIEKTTKRSYSQFSERNWKTCMPRESHKQFGLFLMLRSTMLRFGKAWNSWLRTRTSTTKLSRVIDGTPTISTSSMAKSISSKKSLAHSLITYSLEVYCILEYYHFIDQINLFELYNGLLRAHSQNKELKLDDTIKTVESRYSEILRNNN